jgi:hypothetical protein
MKKILLHRLIAVTIFCFSSLFIKSEISACKIKCKRAVNRIASQRPSLKKEIDNKSVVPHDGFFIKI